MAPTHLTSLRGALRLRLLPASVSREYVKFPAEENKTDDWGKRLYDAWNKTGKCPPVSIAEVETSLTAGK